MISELIGHYRVVASLGSGGMGVVWKAIDTRLNRPVALKAIRESDATSTDAILRLRAEALAAASLDHPYICKIYELLETGTATLVVMEFVEGENLGDILARRTPPLVDTLRWGSEIAEGLANAHARGIVHRDVKPTNVMVTAHNHIKLLDFGIARITGDAALTAKRTDAARQYAGHAAIHGARAGARTTRRRPRGHFLARRPAVPLSHRTVAVRGRHPRRVRAADAVRPGASARTAGASDARPGPRDRQGLPGA